jgi:DNA polymerase-1
LIFEVDEKDAESVAAEFKKIMETITTLKVPLKTSLNIGKHWGELK